MRSRWADKFNHDADAADYDRDVLRADDPIRAGYPELLTWVARQADVGADGLVLELGAGTGNLSLQMLPCRRLTCVDISREMIQLARAKLGDDPRVGFVESDLLGFFDQPRGPYHAVVSTYTIHHLDDDEKAQLFRRIRGALLPEGRAVFGDLMFENAAMRDRLLDEWRQHGLEELRATAEDEPFWNLESALAELRSLGFSVDCQRFSTLSWGVACRLPSSSPSRSVGRPR